MSQGRAFEMSEYCPGCEPERDVQREPAVVGYCFIHIPERTGADDSGTKFDESFETNGNADMEPKTNRAWCDLIHRGRREGRR